MWTYRRGACVIVSYYNGNMADVIFRLDEDFAYEIAKKYVEARFKKPTALLDDMRENVTRWDSDLIWDALNYFVGKKKKWRFETEGCCNASLSFVKDEDEIVIKEEELK